MGLGVQGDQADYKGALGGTTGSRVAPSTQAWPFPRRGGQWSSGQHRPVS